MIDAVEQILMVGNKVICVHKNLPGTIVGCIYTVSNLDESNCLIRLEELGNLSYRPHSFIRINTEMKSFNPQEKADQIMHLINSKPRSPLKSEIIEVLEGK